MSANTACTILFQDGLTAAEATGAFDIAYCLPIYDNRTDGDVMQSPVENSASETADAADPSDFHGFAFPKLSSGAYSLVEWSESTEKVVAYAANSGWAILPPYSQEVSVDGYDAVGALDGAVYTGATLNEGSLTGTTGTYDSLSSWSPDDLYKSVVYLGSKENDGGWKSAYGIHLTCRDPNVSSNAEFVPGGIRFNKVLVFQQGASGVVPVAMVCLPSPVVIAANVAGVANSITINFNFGYDTTLTPQAASFDNTYWSKLPDMSEPVVPLYTPSRVVIGGNGADEVVAENAAITIYEKATDAANYSIIAKTSAGDMFYLSAKHGLMIGDGNFPSNHIANSSIFIQKYSTNTYPSFSIGRAFNASDIVVQTSVVNIIGGSGATDFYTMKRMDNSLFIGGNNSQISHVVDSIYIGEYASSTSWRQAINLDHAILVGDGNGIVKLSSSLLIGNRNYHYIQVTAAQYDTSIYDVLRNSLIVGNDNRVGRSTQSDASNTISDKPIVILGHNNDVINDHDYITSSTNKQSVYIFGSNNDVHSEPSNSIGTTYGEDVPRFVFGNGAKIKGWRWVGPNSTTYGDTEYNHVFDFVIPQYGTFTPTGGTARGNYFSGDDACGISVGFKTTESGGMTSTPQYLIIDTHFKAVESGVSVTGGTATKYGMRLPDTSVVQKDGIICCMDPDFNGPMTELVFVAMLHEMYENGYAPLFVKMPVPNA